MNPAGIYLLKVNNKNTRTRCEICANMFKAIGVVLVSLLLTLNIWIRSGIFIVIFEHISYLVLVFVLLNCRLGTRKSMVKTKKKVSKNFSRTDFMKNLGNFIGKYFRWSSSLVKLYIYSYNPS